MLNSYIIKTLMLFTILNVTKSRLANFVIGPSFNNSINGEESHKIKHLSENSTQLIWDPLENRYVLDEDTNSQDEKASRILTKENQAILAEFGYLDDEDDSHYKKKDLGEVHRVYAVGESEGESTGMASADENLGFAA